MSNALDASIDEFVDAIGVDRACRAFGTPPRSFRYRRRRNAWSSATADFEKATAAIEVTAPGSTAIWNSSAQSDAATAAASLDVSLPVISGSCHAPRRHPSALTIDERHEVLTLLCSDRFVDLSPHQVFMTLLDEGRYVCSVRGMYRILAEHGLSGDRRRGNHRSPGTYPTPIVSAIRPNEAWSWDITKLRGPSKGVVYHLYTILDIFSRKVVGWTLTDRESTRTAQALIRRTLERENVDRDQLTLHADRGAPMIAGDLAELLTSLGVRKSHSRPRVSNDNPYSEAQFKTLKYRPDYPQRFEHLTAARAWCRAFFTWYNTTHYHSGVAYLRPSDVHAGQHPEILQRRQATLDHAYETKPHRFRRPPQAKNPPERSWINQPVIQTS